MEEKKIFFLDYDSAQCELEKITEMLWFVYEDYYAFENQDLYTKANYYDRVGTFLFNIQNLLENLSDRMKEKVENRTEKNTEAKIQNGIIVENGVKHIRMGWENDFVKGVILSDGTILQNMQCNLNAKIPTDEELKAINDKNNKPRWEEIKNG